jgi:hypothetical protein
MPARHRHVTPFFSNVAEYRMAIEPIPVTEAHRGLLYACRVPSWFDTLMIVVTILMCCGFTVATLCLGYHFSVDRSIRWLVVSACSVAFAAFVDAAKVRMSNRN